MELVITLSIVQARDNWVIEGSPLRMAHSHHPDLMDAGNFLSDQLLDAQFQGFAVPSDRGRLLPKQGTSVVCIIIIRPQMHKEVSIYVTGNMLMELGGLEVDYISRWCVDAVDATIAEQAELFQGCCSFDNRAEV